MTLPTDKFRIIRRLDRDGKYYFNIQMKGFLGRYWCVGICDKFYESKENGNIRWAFNGEGVCHHYHVNFRNETVARNYIQYAIWMKAHKIKNETRCKQRIAQKKADAYKVIKFP